MVDITRNLAHFIRTIVQVCGVLKVLWSIRKGFRLETDMGRLVRGLDRVDYVALSNLPSADFEIASKGKRKYKPGSKLCQVDRLVSSGSPRVKRCE